VLADPAIEMSTLRRRIDDDDPDEYANPERGEGRRRRDGFALYFSRAPIPFARRPGSAPAPTLAHVGLYVYRRDTLLRLARCRPCRSSAESLEQLRALEHGIRIKVVETPSTSIGVDTPDDLERVRRSSG
jgi:3-deoxy-manno-octulosonate cytidylyltransferase (CMP-KDO synthetase)